jgi:hypothetical protein
MDSSGSEDYELMPKGELDNLRREVSLMKKNSITDGDKIKVLMDSMDRLTVSINRLVTILDDAQKDIIDEYQKSKPTEKLSQLLDQNELIAKALVAMSDNFSNRSREVISAPASSNNNDRGVNQRVMQDTRTMSSANDFSSNLGNSTNTINTNNNSNLGGFNALGSINNSFPNDYSINSMNNSLGNMNNFNTPNFNNMQGMNNLPIPNNNIGAMNNNTSNAMNNNVNRMSNNINSMSSMNPSVMSMPVDLPPMDSLPPLNDSLPITPKKKFLGIM